MGRIITFSARAAILFLCTPAPISFGRDAAQKSIYPSHCKISDASLVCPSPPLDVAKRAIPDELASWGVPNPPDRIRSQCDYEEWYQRNFVFPRIALPLDGKTHHFPYYFFVCSIYQKPIDGCTPPNCVKVPPAR